MALVGTVSGSNGTTVSAVTGSLIVAANPGTITPVRPTDVVLYVSGAATSVGSDVPSILLKGDAFISGALGTDSYFQMKPVNTLRIPTNTTASYIYTSGSTNDMYFTQYSGPYVNTTRLRWLESALNTGLLNGGVISAAVGGTTFSVTAGEGIIVTQNASTTLPPYPTINNVKWNAVVSQSLTYSGSNQITYLGVNASGGIFQQITPISLIDDSNYISLGRVLHQSGSVVNGTVNAPFVSYGRAQSASDFVRVIGPLKVSGHVLTASGSTLSLTKTAGVSFVLGRNYTSNPDSPDIVTEATDTAMTVSKIYYEYASGSSFIQDTGVGSAGYTVIDPTQYNQNGAGTLVPLLNNNKISVQRAYWFPNSVTKALTIYYGNVEYDTLDEAQAGISTETFTEGNNTVDGAILVAYILVQKSCISLADTTKSRIVQAGTFRGTGIGGGGGSASVTVPGGLDTYVQFNDGGSTFGGDAGLTYNKSTDTLTVAGDVAVNGGDITTSAGTFSIANTTATTVNLGGGASAVNIGAAGSATTFAGNVTGSNALLIGSLIVTGSIKALSGFSGSLTKLTDGTDYLIAGSNITLTTGSSGTVTVANTSIPTLGAVYGGGAHGAFDLDGTNTYASQFTKVGSTYTQIADVRATTFRVRSGSIAQPSQFWIYAESAFRNDGTIRNNGNSGSLGVAGATVAAAGTLQCQGIAGSTGRTSTANGFAVNGLSVIGGGGGTGGAGGASTGGTSSPSAPGATAQAVGTSFFMTTHRRLEGTTVGTVSAGIGGGSGGATLNSGTATSGGSGGGGSAIRINARSFQNNGTITCNGGAGGNATTTLDAVAGGGGGGGGGFIGIMCDTLVSLGTVTCTGGLGGLGSGGGTAGGMGLSGSISVVTPTGTTNL